MEKTCIFVMKDSVITYSKGDGADPSKVKYNENWLGRRVKHSRTRSKETGYLNDFDGVFN